LSLLDFGTVCVVCFLGKKQVAVDFEAVGVISASRLGSRLIWLAILYIVYTFFDVLYKIFSMLDGRKGGRMDEDETEMGFCGW
jgi:hypothetical protein